MARRWRSWVLVGAIAVAAAGCGGGRADEIGDDTVPDVDEIGEDRAEIDSDVDADDLTPQEQILAAFSGLGEGRGFRSSVSTAQTFDIPVMGVSSSSTIDPSRPMLTMEVAPNGDLHQYLDLGPTFTALVDDAAIAAQLDAVHAEMWVVGDVLTIDATGYQPLADIYPGSPLGPFEPGIGTVDLTVLGESGQDDLVAVMVGAVVDPVTLALTLPASLDDIEQDPDDPGRFVATVSYDELLRAQGADPDVQSRILAVSIAPATGIDAEALASVFSDYFRTLDVDVELVVSDGVVVSLSTFSDLSGLFRTLAESESLFVDAAPGEREQAALLFDDAVQYVESLTTFDLDDSVVVTPPVGDYEDRTEAAIDLVSAISPG